jgi:hypothetical protein
VGHLLPAAELVHNRLNARGKFGIQIRWETRVDITKATQEAGNVTEIAFDGSCFELTTPKVVPSSKVGGI